MEAPDYGGRIGSAEMLQLPWNDDDTGVWTDLIEALTPRFGTTFLVNLNNRIISVGELIINLVTMSSKLSCLIINYFHSRGIQAVCKFATKLRIRVSGKNSSIAG